MKCRFPPEPALDLIGGGNDKFMRNYSSNRAQKGKTAYRTPSLYKANKAIKTADVKARVSTEVNNKDNYYLRFKK